MPDFGATRTNIEYETRALQKWFRRSMYLEVVNRDFMTKDVEDPKKTKKVTEQFQEFVVTTLTGGGWKSTAGTGSITYTDVKESVSRLVIDTFLELADSIKSVAAFASAVKDPDSEIINQAAQSLYEEMDQTILGFYHDAAAGHWLGTVYAAGTVAIAAVTGVVTGSGTTFTSDMVGKPFKAAGHSKFYRVKAYTSTTSITIENDLDDEASAYDGGAISAGAAYEIQANTKIALTQNNFKFNLDILAAMHTKDGIPNDGNRWIALPVMAASPVLLEAAAEKGTGLGKVYDEVTEKGEIGKISGFRVFFLPDEWFTGNNSSGFFCVGGHKSFLTGAWAFLDSPHVIPAEQNQTGHSALVKGLFGHGEKVADERRKAGVCLYANFNIA